MEKKLLFVLFALCLALPLSLVFSACSGKSNSKNVSRIEFRYGSEVGQYINVSYEYGTPVEILYNTDSSKELGLWAFFMDGSEKNVSSEVKESDIKYYKQIEVQKGDHMEIDYEEIDSIPRLPDVGTYQMKINYGGHEAVLSIWVYPTENSNGMSFVVGNNNQYKYNQENVEVQFKHNGVTKNIDFSLYCLTANQYDENCKDKSETEQIEYLHNYTISSESVNIYVEKKDDGKIYIGNTRYLENGTYYFFVAYYPFENYASGYTLPRRVTIAKGDFTINTEIATFNAKHTFSTSYFEKDVALSDITITATGATFLGDNATIFGSFVFASGDTKVTGAENGTSKQIKFIFNDGYSEYARNFNYENWRRTITVTLEKGQVEKPYILKTIDGFNVDSNTYTVAYTGNEHNYLAETGNYSNLETWNTLCDISGNAKTNVNSAPMTITLKSTNNYEWVEPVLTDPENYYFGAQNGASLSFAWSVVKGNQNACDYYVYFVIENSDNSSEINWKDGGQYTITITPPWLYPTNTEWTWEVTSQQDANDQVVSNLATLASSTTTGLTNTITFTKAGQVFIKLTNTGDSNFNALVQNENPHTVQLTVRKAPLAHEEEILELGNAKFGEPYVATATNGKVLLPSGIIPENPYADEGSWVLYRYSFGDKVILSTGADTQIDSTGDYECTLNFVPNDTDNYRTVEFKEEYIDKYIILRVQSTDIENAADIIAEAPSTYSADMNGELAYSLASGNIRIPDIIPSSAYSESGSWYIYVPGIDYNEIEVDQISYGQTYPTAIYNCGTTAHAENWKLVFIPNTGLYNKIIVDVTIYFMSYAPEYEDIAQALSSYTTAYTATLVNGEAQITVTLPDNNYPQIGEWHIYNDNGILQTTTLSFTQAGYYNNYIVKFDISDQYENHELYYGPSAWLNITINNPSTLSSSDISQLKSALSMGANDETAQITLTENDGVYEYTVPTPTNMSQAGTLKLYYSNGTTSHQFNGSITSDVAANNANLTWYFIYDVTSPNYLDYRIDVSVALS